MVSGNKVVTTIIILLLVVLSGCTGKNNIAPAPDSTQKETVDVSPQNLTRSSKELPDIKITSFSSVYMHDNSNNEDIYLFSWENVPGNDSRGLLSFIKNELRIDGMENAQITRDDANKTIRVFNDENPIEIMQYNESVCFKIGANDCKNYDLLVKEENGRHNIYKRIYRNKHQISERYYAAYNLSIKNNGPNTIDFKLNDLRLHEGYRIFNTTILEPYGG